MSLSENIRSIRVQEKARAAARLAGKPFGGTIPRQILDLYRENHPQTTKVGGGKVISIEDVKRERTEAEMWFIEASWLDAERRLGLERRETR